MVWDAEKHYEQAEISIQEAHGSADKIAAST